MERSDRLRGRRNAPSIDEVLTALVASGVFDTLHIANEDLANVRSDPSLAETLTITYELLMTFDDSGVLETFFCLPKEDQARFLRWIGSTDDVETRDRRTATFVSALRTAPLEPPAPAPVREARDNRAQA